MFVSCVDDRSQNADEGDIPVEEGEAFMSLNIKAGSLSPLSRSGDAHATAEELAVHSVRVVLYDGTAVSSASCKVEYVFEFDIRTPGSWDNTTDYDGWVADLSTGTGEVNDYYVIPSGNHLATNTRNDLQFTTFAQRIKDKPYKMLVIINGKNADGSDNSPIYEATNKGSFLLSFEQTISTDIIDPETGTVDGGKGIIMTNHQGLVEVTKDQLAKTLNLAHSSPIQVSVDRMVAKVTVKFGDNYVRPAGVIAGSETWAIDVTNKYTYWMRNKVSDETPQSSMEHLYAVDPNYSIYTSDKDKKANFNYLYEDNIIPSSAINNTQFNTYKYIPENTINATTEIYNTYSDQVTTVIIGYRYTPPGLQADDNYYVYNNKVVTQEEMDKFLNDPTHFVPGLETFRDMLDVIDRTKYSLQGNSPHFYESSGLRFCPKGQLYYIVPIQHFNRIPGGLGTLGVVRNNIYDLTINSITPPELAGPYLSAHITIRPWAERSQGNTIGLNMTEKPFYPVKVYYWSIKDNSNLYKDWWIAQTGQIAGAPDYRKLMYNLDAEVSGSSLKMNFDHYTYMFSTPATVIVSDDPLNNEIHLFYWNGDLFGASQVTVPICFTDEEGNILNVEYTSGKAENNPNILLFHPETIGSGASGLIGGIYVKTLGSIYNITDSGGNGYTVKDSNYAKFYISENGSKVTFENDTYVAEPIRVAIASNGITNNPNWAKDGNPMIAIICKPSN